MNTPSITTERLILRQFTKDDIDALFHILNDEQTNTFLPWFPIKDIDEATQYYQNNYASKYNLPRAYAYAICLKEDNIPIGYIDIDTKHFIELGYGLHKDYWHNGIMTEAALAIVDLARKEGIPFLIATHDINNPRSGEVMKKIGMTYRYSYHEQWQPKDIPVVFRMYQINLNCDDNYTYDKLWNCSTNHFIEAL